MYKGRQLLFHSQRILRTHPLSLNVKPILTTNQSFKNLYFHSYIIKHALCLGFVIVRTHQNIGERDALISQQPFLTESLRAAAMFKWRLCFPSQAFLLRLCFKGNYVSRAYKNTGNTVLIFLFSKNQNRMFYHNFRFSDPQSKPKLGDIFKYEFY